MLKNFLYKLKIVYLSIQNKLPILLGRIFTKSNFKVIIIFIVNFYNINIFSYSFFIVLYIRYNKKKL
jgi:hypothetical protein